MSDINEKKTDVGKEIERPKIKKEDYMEKLELLAEYAENDALSLSSYRAVNVEIYKKIFEYAWEGKDIDF